MLKLWRKQVDMIRSAFAESMRSGTGATRERDDFVGVRKVGVKVLKEANMPQDEFVPIFCDDTNDERKRVRVDLVRYIDDDGSIPDGQLAAGGMNRDLHVRKPQDAKFGGNRLGDVGFVSPRVEQGSHFGGTLRPVEVNGNDGSIENVKLRSGRSWLDALR